MDYDFFSINKKRTILNKCVRCGICIGICPIYRISRLETDSPRGRLELMRCLDENKSPSGYDCKSSLEQCLFCLQCQRNCPAGVEFDLAFFSAMGLIKIFVPPSNPAGVFTRHLMEMCQGMGTTASRGA